MTGRCGNGRRPALERSAASCHIVSYCIVSYDNHVCCILLSSYRIASWSCCIVSYGILQYSNHIVSFASHCIVSYCIVSYSYDNRTISYLTIMISYRNAVSLHRIVSCLTVHCTTVIVSYPRHIVSHLISVFSAAAANRSKVTGCPLHCVSGHMYSKHRA